MGVGVWAYRGGYQGKLGFYGFGVYYTVFSNPYIQTAIFMMAG
jgi:hypothetical protein